MRTIKRATAAAALAMVAACEEPAADSNATHANAADSPTLNGPVAADRASKTIVPAPDREAIAYTSLKPADCKLLDQNVEEGGYSRHRCEGIAGYALETGESDLRQSLTVIAPGGKRTELGLSARIAKGAFNALGPAAEWRGEDRTAPSALIVRLNVAKPEPNTSDTSNLVVIRLGSTICVTAVVLPGPAQNDMARDAADGPPRSCLKD